MNTPLSSTRLVRAASLVVTTAFLATGAKAAPLTPGNVIASVNEFTGSSDAPTYIAEYTPAGVRVQILAPVPTPGGTLPTTDQARDLVLGPGNAIHLYNGTFDPFLARLDLATSAWTQQTFTGWSTVNNTTYGGLARFGNFLYAADMNTAGDTPQGVVRFDTLGGATVRFATGIQPSDVAIGLDGLLYAINAASSPTNLIHKFDPLTFASLGTVTIASSGYRGVTVGVDGTIYTADSNGVIRRHSPTGTLLDSLTVPGAFFSDIDLDPNGKITLGTIFGGEIVFTDTALDTFTSFRATESASGGETFVAWVPAPEPTTALLLLGGAGFLFGSSRRRSD